MGIVHRDLKPSNLFVDGWGQHMSVKVLDFGIAKFLGADSITQTGTVVGTPVYMAPELLKGEKPTPACDVYALGVVLFQLLTGRFPFALPESPKGLWEVIGAVAHAHEKGLPRVSKYADVPPALDRLVADCLQVDPADRPADGRALAKRIDGLTDEPEEKKPLPVGVDRGPAPAIAAATAGAAYLGTLFPKEAEGLGDVPVTVTDPPPTGRGRSAADRRGHGSAAAHRLTRRSDAARELPPRAERGGRRAPGDLHAPAVLPREHGLLRERRARGSGRPEQGLLRRHAVSGRLLAPIARPRARRSAASGSGPTCGSTTATPARRRRPPLAPPRSSRARRRRISTGTASRRCSSSGPRTANRTNHLVAPIPSIGDPGHCAVGKTYSGEIVDCNPGEI